MTVQKWLGPMVLFICCVTLPGARVHSRNADSREDRMDDKKAIESAIAEFASAYNAGDLARVLAYYGDDLIKVRNGAPPETKAETAKRIAAAFEKFRSRVEVANEEIHVSGDFAFTRGSFRVTLMPKAGGDSQIADRRYLEIWRKESGRWLVVRTMDNVD
jgi:ketosteroid isomerase-like protein